MKEICNAFWMNATSRKSTEYMEVCLERETFPGLKFRRLIISLLQLSNEKDIICICI
jgi:hypothetical protein